MTPNEKLNHPLSRLADRIATEAHAGQFCKMSTIPFVVHPRRVASLVATLDSVSEVDVAAALLHHTLDRTSLTPMTLARKLLAGGTAPEVVSQVVNLVVELTKPYRSDSHLRQAEKRAKDREQLGSMSDRAKRIKMCDQIDTLVAGQTTLHHDLPVYLAESRDVVDECGDVDPILGGWLLAEMHSLTQQITES